MADRDFSVGGDRSVTVHVPPGSDPETPAPVLILLHGYGSSGDEQESYVQLAPVAAAHGILYLHPDGTTDSRGVHFWNGTDACCDLEGSGVDDSGYLAGLVVEIGQRVAVDPRRVYFVGHSNGAFMSYRMACDHADLVAAIVSFAGATYKTAGKCTPSAPVAVLEIHGTADDAVRIDGGNVGGVVGGSGLADYPPTEASLAAWAAYDGCSDQPTRSLDALDLDVRLSGPSGPNETSITAYADECDPGGHAELWTIEDGSHVPDLTPGFGASVIDFLLAHPKP